MKNLITILFIAISINGLSQSLDFKIDQGNLDIYAKNDVSIDSVVKIFKLSDKLLSSKYKFYDRYVYTASKTYYRAGFGAFRQPKVYEIVNNEFITLNASNSGTKYDSIINDIVDNFISEINSRNINYTHKSLVVKVQGLRFWNSLGRCEVDKNKNVTITLDETFIKKAYKRHDYNAIKIILWHELFHSIGVDHAHDNGIMDVYLINNKHSFKKIDTQLLFENVIKTII
jgi:hypothetical protein